MLVKESAVDAERGPQARARASRKRKTARARGLPEENQFIGRESARE